MADDVGVALAHVVAALPGGGEARAGQLTMAEAVAEAIREQRHLAVQAGTGTGKTLAYLVPAILSGRPVVVATATKALQDQLAGKDLPFLQAHLGRPFEWAVLKGRSNYVCMQRLSEIGSAAGEGTQQSLDGVAERAPAEELVEIARWATRTDSGDRADLDREPSERAWSAVSVSARECPGAARCPSGSICFAEAARSRAAEADVVVVNLHLYGLHLASEGVILPDHDIVIIDEAHQLEDVVSATSGLELGAGRFSDLARKLRGVVADDGLAAGIDDAGRLLAEALRPHRDSRLRRLPDDLAGALAVVVGRVQSALDASRALPANATDDVRTRATRLQQSAGALLDDLHAVSLPGDDVVLWVEGPEPAPVLRVAPIDVAELLRDGLWSKPSVVLTSATLPGRLGQRLGMPAGRAEPLDVGSPFDYEANALLYSRGSPARPAARGLRRGDDRRAG